MSRAQSPDVNIIGDTDSLQSQIPLHRRMEPDFYQLEVERVFKRSWLIIGHVGDVAEPGAYFVINLPTFKSSVIVTRDQTGRIRAYHNICRHRGNRLIHTTENFTCGKAKVFVCGFHGWSFNSDGTLRNVPEEAMYAGLDKKQHGLLEIPVATWGGLIFAYFGGTPRLSLEEWLGEIYPGFDGYFDKMERIGGFQAELACNWNIAIDSFSEGFHVVFLHRQTTPSLIPRRGDETDSMLPQPRIDLFRRHQRTAAAANPERTSPPAEALLYRHGRRLTPDFDTDLEDLPSGVNPTRVQPWLFDDVKLLPNVSFINGAQWCTLLQVWPDGPGHCRIDLNCFATKARHAGDRLAQAYMRSMLYHVTLEDMLTMEPIDQNLRSGALPHIVLSLHEIALQKRYRAIDDMIEEPI